MLHAHGQPSVLEQRPNAGQGLDARQGDHHNTSRSQSRQHLLQQALPLGAPAPEQNPVGLAELAREPAVQHRGGVGLQHRRRADAEPLCIALDQLRATGAAFHRQQLQPWAQAQRFQTDAAGAGSQIPEHALRRQGEFGQELDAHLPLGHQSGVIAVLQVEPVIEPEQRQLMRIRCGGFAGDQQCNQQRLQICW